MSEKNQRLSDLIKGDEALIYGFDKIMCNKQKIRLSALGFVPNTYVKIIKHFPGHVIQIKGAKYALGKKICQKIYVKKI